MLPADRIDDLRRALTEPADPVTAPQRASYMQHHFVFLGVSSPARRVAERPFVAAGVGATSSQLLDTARRLLDPARTGVPARGHRPAGSLGALALVVGPRASRAADPDGFVVGHGRLTCGERRRPDGGRRRIAFHDDRPLDRRRRPLDRRLGDPPPVVRDRTDASRLFDFVDRRCHEPDCFLRKASGWALREYAKTNPDAVRAYVTNRGDRLSGLTRREALKHLAG